MADSGANEEKRHRKPSDLANSEGAKSERALALKRSKSGYVGQLSKYYDEVEGIIARSDKYTDVDIVIKIKDKISALFEVFQECHYEYLENLTDPNDRDIAEAVKHSVCSNKRDFDYKINSWIGEMREKHLQVACDIDDVRASDSVSLASLNTNRSSSTTASKMKLKAEAKRAVAILKLKQLEESQALQDEIDETEIKIKLDEAVKLNKMKRRQALLEAQHEAQRLSAEVEVYKSYELQDDIIKTAINIELQSERDTELYKQSSIKTELHNTDNIKSHEKHESHDVYNDSKEHDPLELQRSNGNENRYLENPFQDNELISSTSFITPHKEHKRKESTRVFDANTSNTNPFRSTIMEASPITNTSNHFEESPRHLFRDAPETPSAKEWLEMNSPKKSVNIVDTFHSQDEPQSERGAGVYDEIVKQQERIMSTMTNALRLPKPELFTFDGNPLNYWRFIRNFERNIEEKSTDEVDKLNYLLQYCTGKAREVVRNCVVMEPSLGYTTARKLLKERFGEPYVIASAHIEQITKGPPLKASDREGLLNLADKLKDCELTLNSIGYLDDLNSTDNLKHITERFPIHLKARWLDQARIIRNNGGRPNIGHMSKFISEKALAANDPVFGDIMDVKDHIKNERPKPKLSRPTRPTSRPSTYSTQTESSKSPNETSMNPTSNKPNIVREMKCWLCEGAHMLTSCLEFTKKCVDDRLKTTRGKGLCDNCFKRGHKSKECYKRGQCTVDGCSGKHHTLLHGSFKPTKQDSTPKDNAQCHVNNVYNTFSSNKVCLPIVPVRVRGKDRNICITTYALLDQGSDTTLCEQRLLDQLNLEGEQRTFSLTTVDSVSKRKQGRIASLEVLPISSDEVIEIPSVWSVDKLCITTQGVPTQNDLMNWPHLNGLRVPAIDRSEVTLLIGNDTPEVFWTLEERRGNRKEPYAVKSLLGWTILGPVGRTANCNSLNTFSVTLQDDSLLTQVEKFWKADFGDPLFSVTETMSVEDRRALSIMDESITLVEGHYQVALPWRYGEPYEMNNRPLAESRLSSLTRKLKKDTDIYQKYKSVIDDHLAKGYARQVSTECNDHTETPVWYLPHHAVINPRKPDKLRVVYDCAAKWKSVSLNDQLLQGPDMTNNLVGVLTRFREQSIALAADIEAMFLQVQVHPKDRNMLRFLWYENGDLNKEPTEFQMLCHIFGATSSPSIAGFALKRTADDNHDDFDADIVNSIYRNFYVDDFLKSVKTVSEAKHMYQGTTQLLQRGGFRLTKWISNDKSVLDSIPEDERAKSVKKLDFDEFPKERTLGVHWEVETDRLGLQPDVKEKPFTRRGILSSMSSVFDPLGIVAPLIMPAKVLLQSLCKQNIGWDDLIPNEASVKWSKWLRDLPELSNVSIPRCLEPPSLGEVTRELHHFGDASQTGYGAVSYLRSETLDGEINVSFLLGKSRLAPVKSTSIPRLELSAATLAVKLDCTIRQELDLPIHGGSWFWTDSTAVLRYILNENRRFSTFVANRLAIIHEASNAKQWLYVDSASNPADDASRGLSSSELISEDSRWLHGPEFLRRGKETWPNQPNGLSDISDDDPEVKKDKSVKAIQGNEEDVLSKMFKRFSSWERLRVAVAWLLRYKRFLVTSYRQRHGLGQREKIQNHSHVSVKEMKGAELEIIRCIQRKSFAREIKSLKANSLQQRKMDKVSTVTKNVDRSSPVYKLNPILIDDVLCVGGRLENATIPERSKHPPILPKENHVCALIARHYHQLYGHAGKEHVLSLIRRDFWIIRARVLVKRLIGQCFDCRRRRQPPCEQVMASLPQDRVTPGKPPFSYVGVDYFGPIQVKRGRSIVKRYGCLFTCLTTRAVHIEIAHSLDTCSFIDALYRFINRRGKPELIRSDNGTNFKGGQRELRESIEQWNQQAIFKLLRQREIEWIFNPPAASNMGGVWERMIRSVRQILRALLKEQIVDDETLLTVMTHVEAILNSRPLTACSDDPKDKNPLTPNQILLLRDNTSLPPGVFSKSDLYGRRRWRQAQYLADQFWKRWLKEYLPQLQERSKWNRPRRNIAVDDIVLVVDQSVARGDWPIARVLEVYMGKDGYVRSARVKTKSSILTRPVNKLCLLEGTGERDSML